MKITYEISKNKSRQFIWRRKHANGKIHSSGESSGFKRLQGALRAILSDCGCPDDGSVTKGIAKEFQSQQENKLKTIWTSRVSPLGTVRIELK